MTKLEATRYGDTWVRIGDEMTWPRACGHMRHLAWICRYGSSAELEKHRYQFASVMDAYDALISLSQKQRNAICKAIASVDDGLDGLQFEELMRSSKVTPCTRSCCVDGSIVTPEGLALCPECKQ